MAGTKSSIRDAMRYAMLLTYALDPTLLLHLRYCMCYILQTHYHGFMVGECPNFTLNAGLDANICYSIRIYYVDLYIRLRATLRTYVWPM